MESAPSPWGKASKAPAVPCSFSALMDEEYAKQLQQEEQPQPINVVETELDILTDEGENPIATSDDLLLAQMMQMEFNKEYDDFIKKREKVVNKNSNVTVSFEKYCSLHPSERELSSSENDDDGDDDDEEFFEEDNERSVTRKRPIGPGANIVTKHDAIVCGRKNTKNIENFPPMFAAGDVSSKGLDIRLPNHVFNALKMHSKKEEKYNNKIHDRKERATHDQALDPKTRILLYKLVNSEALDCINGCISTGKEAVVFHAKGGLYEGEIFPNECAIKVYKTTLIEFKTRDKYIKEDFRFRDRYSKQNPRKIVRLWAEKEMRNLKRMHQSKINCPQALLLRKHILVMSFIGHNQKPAPKLKDAKLSFPDLAIAYEQCIKMMKTMFQECNLIHADLSEYNMLWHEDKLWFIDVSQSIEPTHPRALEFLVRDCTNVVNYFTKAGLPEIMNVEELFHHVSGLQITGEQEEFLNQIRGYERSEEVLANGMAEENYNFEHFFDKSNPVDTADQDSE